MYRMWEIKKWNRKFEIINLSFKELIKLNLNLKLIYLWK
jgi:hypothetical protein